MIRKIGVIGAGQMGRGIAHVCALAGYDVTMVDISEAQLAKAMDRIEQALDRQVSRSEIEPADKPAALSRIRT